MLYRKALLVFMSICLLFPITGCWDSLDVNNKTLVVTVIADKQDDDFAFYIETPNLSLGQNQLNSSDGNQKFYRIYAKGTSFADARRHINAKVDAPTFLGTVKALVVTDELGKYGIEEYMLRMQADVQYRKTLNVITSFSDPEEILAAQPPNNVSIGESINDSIASLIFQRKIKTYTVSDLLEFIHSNTCFVVINMDVEDEVLTYNGYSVFHNKKLIDFIPVEESNGLLWIIGDRLKRIYEVPYQGGEATVEVYLKTKEITPMFENGKVSFDLKYKFEAKLMYISHNVNVGKDLQTEIKKNLINDIVNDIAEALKCAQSLSCDYLQLKEYFRIKYPSELKEMIWHDAFVNASFSVSAQTNLTFGSTVDFEGDGDNQKK